MNSDIKKIISAEWLKLKKRKTTWVVPLVLGLLCLVMFFGLDLASRRNWVGMPSGFYLASATISWIINAIVLVIVIAACFHISREFALGTIKSAWVRPLTRRSWYGGKILSIWAAMAGLFLFAVLIIVALAALRFGFTDLMEKDYLVHSRSALGLRFALMVFLTLWALLATASVISMLAGFFNNPGGAIACGLSLGLLMTVLAVFPGWRPFLLNSYISLPCEQMVAMSKGLALPMSWNELTRQILIGAGGWMIVSLLIGDWVIRKKEITF
jgi:ABC-type transport system involved in multi-copper enzyme maturation permease subunit